MPEALTTAPPPHSHSLTVSVPEAAAILGVSPRTVYRAVRRGDLAAVHVGRRVVVPAHRLFELLDARADSP